MWYRPKHDDSFEFKTYDVQNGKGQHRIYKFSQALAAEHNIPKVETLVMNAWELRRNEFIFVCLVNKTDNKKGGGVNSNYVIDIMNNGAIREAKFTFGPYQDYLIDCYSLGPNAMFRTFKIEEGKVQTTPTYYIDNESETLIAEETWECSYLYKYEFEGYASGLLCEGLYENRDVSSFKVNLKRVVYPRDVYLFLLKEGQKETGVVLEKELIEDVLFVLS